MIKVQIVDGGGSGRGACVTEFGELVTSPIQHNDTKFNELAETNTAYNFYEPKAGQRFVISGCYFRADRQVSSTVDAIVVIYEADDAETTTVDKTLIQFAVVRGDSVDASNLNILVNSGKFVSAKTTDDDIHMTITGYYVID